MSKKDVAMLLITRVAEDSLVDELQGGALHLCLIEGGTWVAFSGAWRIGNGTPIIEEIRHKWFQGKSELEDLVDGGLVD